MVEIIYDADCPNLDAARQQLRRAFEKVDLPARWKEWERGSSESPDYVSYYGSPTILVGGLDVDRLGRATVHETGLAYCRIYKDASGKPTPVPSLDSVVEALLASSQAKTSQKRRPGGRALTAVPGVIMASLPVGVCPACWPVYTALLGSGGLGFLLQTSYLLPLTVLSLALALGGLVYGAREGRGFGPLVLGLVAFALIVAGRFVAANDPVSYSGIVFLAGAAVWNAWPKRSLRGIDCRCSETPKLISKGDSDYE